ncbi:MAG: hypothetical protein ACD_73C00259G0001 [uncultured bacterium]|nr:MAG: hypothetical protein ACD_73C00259G0001 [uncultured bacterium]
MHQYLYHVAHITKVGLVPIDPQFMVDDQDQIHWIDFEEWEKYDPPQTHGDWQTLFDKVDHMFGIREYLRDLFGTNKIPPPWEIIERYETLATDSDFVEELAPPDDEIQPGNADINQSDTAVAHIGLVTAPVIGTGLPTTASPGIMTK